MECLCFRNQWIAYRGSENPDQQTLIFSELKRFVYNILCCFIRNEVLILCSCHHTSQSNLIRGVELSEELFNVCRRYWSSVIDNKNWKWTKSDKLRVTESDVFGENNSKIFLEMIY